MSAFKEASEEKLFEEINSLMDEVTKKIDDSIGDMAMLKGAESEVVLKQDGGKTTPRPSSRAASNIGGGITPEQLKMIMKHGKEISRISSIVEQIKLKQLP